LQECDGSECNKLQINEAEINSKIEKITYNDVANYHNSPVNLDVIYWKDFKNIKKSQAVHFCNQDGIFVADNYNPIEIPKKISIHLKSQGFVVNDIDFATTEIENILTIARNKAWEFYNQQIIKLNQERLSEFKITAFYREKMKH
jgi:hypothetical protein